MILHRHLGSLEVECLHDGSQAVELGHDAANHKEDGLPFRGLVVLIGHEATGAERHEFNHHRGESVGVFLLDNLVGAYPYLIVRRRPNVQNVLLFCSNGDTVLRVDGVLGLHHVQSGHGEAVVPQKVSDEPRVPQGDVGNELAIQALAEENSPSSPATQAELPVGKGVDALPTQLLVLLVG